MKAELLFDLDNRDDVMAHKRCVKSIEMALVIWEFYYNSKKTIENKLSDKENLNPYDVLDMVFKEFCDLLDEHGVLIDDLVD